MTVPVKRNLAHIEAVLHMPCVGESALAYSSVKLQPIGDGDQSDAKSLYLFGKVVVHGSHTMATHLGLRTHFCIACGAHGTLRSNYLREPGAQMLRPSGKEALRLIALGKHPGTYLNAPLVKRRLTGSTRDSAPGKPPRNRLYGASLRIGIKISKTSR